MNASKILASSILIVCLALSSSAFAENDYPYRGTEYSCRAIDPWGFYMKNCTSFVAWRMNRDGRVMPTGDEENPAFTNSMHGGHWGDAGNWDNNAEILGLPVNQTPSPGAIAHWESGHVAYVESVNPDGSVNISEYNYSNGCGFGIREEVRANNYIHVNAGTLIRAEEDIEVYWLQNGIKYHVLNVPIAYAMTTADLPGWKWPKFTELPRETVDGYPEGPKFIAANSSSEGLLVRQFGTNSIYRISNGAFELLPLKLCLNDAANIIDLPKDSLAMLIPRNGGTISFPDGSISVTFPANAVSEDMYVSIVKTDEATLPVNGHFFLIGGNAYDITATNEYGRVFTTFASDLRVTLQYNPDELHGINEQILQVGYYNEDPPACMILPSTVDSEHHKVTGITNHFTKFAVMVTAPPAPPIPTEPPDPSTVPEPATLLLFGIGLIGVLALVKKTLRRKSAKEC